MTIDILTICEWSLASVTSEDVERPCWEEVEDAVRKLDGRARNDLYLCPVAANNETYLAVGGGSGRYLVTGSIDNERFPTVVRSEPDDGTREQLVVGGQSGDYPRHWILDLDTTLRAVKSFFETGEFGGGEVSWIEG